MDEPVTTWHDPVGFCIYCGASAAVTTLEDEHIIPYAIRGRFVLPQASCRTCADTINKGFETFCLQNMLLVPRAHFQMKGRNRGRKKRPLPTSFPIVTPQGEVQTALDEYPPTLQLIAYPRAGFLRGAHVQQNSKCHSLAYMSKRKMEKFDKHDEWAFKGSFSPQKFARFVAKIAHGASVAQLGWGQFDPFLPEVILGKDPFATHYVGSLPEPYRKGEGGHMTRVGHCRFPNGLSVVWANVWFFSDFGTPIYEVVVGTNLTPLGLSRLPPARS
jgi:hypothetical protein